VLITFEGIEAAGKSTLIAALAKELTTRGDPVLITKEPGGTPFGDALRSIFLDPFFRVDPIAEVMVLNAPGALGGAVVLGRAGRPPTTVLGDRFFDATVAYQGYGRGLDIDSLLEICLVATQRIAPHLTFLVDIPVALSAERVRARGGADRLEREDEAFHTRVRTGYLAMAERFAKRFVVLDGTEALEVLVAQACAAFDRRRDQR
jgi:dTMP kinase